MDINDTLLVTINLSDTEESTVEVVTYLSQYRDIINVFKGPDAELLYKTLMQVNKKQLKAYLEQLSKKESLDPESEPLTLVQQALVDVTLMGPVIKPYIDTDSLKWKYANPALGKISTKEVDGETIYILNKQEGNDDRNLEKSTTEA